MRSVKQKVLYCQKTMQGSNEVTTKTPNKAATEKRTKTRNRQEMGKKRREKKIQLETVTRH